MLRSLVALTATVLLCTASHAQSVSSARAELIDTQGKKVGTATIRESAGQGLWIEVSLTGVPSGPRAMHVHETGKCEGDFKSAGNHYNPDDHKHGILAEGGAHAGDLPNIHVPESGELQIEVFAPRLTLAKDAKNTVFDKDGSSLVIHEKIDDYKSQPSGDAGGRFACGVIEPATAKE